MSKFSLAAKNFVHRNILSAKNFFRRNILSAVILSNTMFSKNFVSMMLLADLFHYRLNYSKRGEGSSECYVLIWRIFILPVGTPFEF